MSKFEKPKSSAEFDEAEHLLVSGISKQMYALEEARDKGEGGEDYNDNLERLRELSGFWPVFMNRVIEWNSEKDLEPLAKSLLEDFMENDPEKAVKILEEIEEVGKMALEELGKPDALRVLFHLGKSLALFSDEKLFSDPQAREKIIIAAQEARNRLQELKGQIAQQK